jgi:hypothetical protein
MSRQAAQLSFIPQGYKFRLSRQAAQLSYNPHAGFGFRNQQPACYFFAQPLKSSHGK